MNTKRIQPFSIIFLIAFFTLSFQYSYAQWSSGSGYIYYTGGKVGIGTSSPQDKLHLWDNGTTSSGFRIKPGSSNQAHDIIRSFKQGGYGLILRAQTTNSGKGQTSIVMKSSDGYSTKTSIIANYIDLRTGSEFQDTNVLDTDGQSALYIDNDQRIGIGTTSLDATAKLTVQGKIHSQEVKVTATAGADFVFEENYIPPTLEEVENYVKTHKHLPEIPSANEMIENGVELGEFQIKLLQKIEELTLYVIEQNKKIEKQNETLEKQNEEIVHLKNENQKLHSTNEKIQQTISNLK